MEKNFDQHLLLNEDEMFHIFTSLFDIVFLMKLIPPGDFQYIKVSESAKKLASLTDEDIGKTISEVFHPVLAEELNKNYLRSVEKNGPITYRDRLNTEEEKYGETVLIPFIFKGQQYVIGLTRDITQVVLIEKMQASDPITGLPFTENFIRSLHSTIRLKKFEGSIWGLFYISITQLSFVQYTNQNAEADLLRQIAGRLKRFLKQEDLLSRVSGNEFVLAIRLHDVNEYKDIGHHLYEALNYPYKTEDFETIINPAIGIAIINEDSLDIQAGLNAAFQSMLRAKTKPGKQISFPSDIAKGESSRKFIIERDLTFALQKGQFQLYYQPKIDISKSEINAEALIRWIHPSFGLVPPNEFIPIAEQNKLIILIGKWVIEQVCKDLKLFQQIQPNMKISINVSPVQINDSNFVEDLKRIVQKQGIHPSSIEIEITESDLLNIPSAKTQFHALANEGFHIVLDDFGVSYSSLNYLKEFSVQKIKIDKSFIMNMDFLQKDEQIVQMIIKLAKNLELEVTAEGVEKSKHVLMLTNMGCDELQGYYISKPLPIEDVLERIKNNQVMINFSSL
jgi:EAL domain-containing protein (putative c-di-GMP-specific phosphodiesterase class I)/GGDEF domain-containing protein